ncbi:protein-disulfide reductase DsbD [Vibrio sp. UCD-FRSSP16_10]|uniref:protein-disulfide reductase DsbD n=1 Tax=unclassified Vibrio TaxID=2614977 RepID=UPI000801BBDD|nr:MULTISPECIES: protein-disulfide reductase DsbD [unclassified Vibrio]OBT16435.1 protein-disulfide reductase DsbD [Vibrio sp. UCD-FRSSP16_30]OBT21300.1 protein-disulfide reductase DsbD [Vibrio sp. UCD-FRSSP16_10]
MRAVLLSLLFLCFSQTALAAFNSDSTSTAQNNFEQASFGQSDFVRVDQAFPFDFIQQDNQVQLNWQVADGYYLYQSRFHVTANNASLGELSLKDGTPYQDEFFGLVNIYTEPVTITVPITAQNDNAQLVVQFQGCAKAGFCYPPETKIIDLQPTTGASAVSTSKNNTAAIKQTATTDTNQASLPKSESDMAAMLGDSIWTPLIFLALGIGLAFTPCVLPMYPILTSIVLGNGKQSHARALSLSFVYVQGMALTYTLLGLVVASAGMQFQAALQHPVVLITISVLFVLLSLSMFGLYNLQLPSSLQTKLNEISNQQKGGQWFGAFAMGVISGLVCSPCTTAPLSGALLYVAQTGDLFTGAITLYALALGMGIPLITLAVFGNRFLPKAGLWMDKVKVLFGFVLLAAPLFFLERILSEQWVSALWSILGVTFFAWLYHAKNHLPFGSWKQSLVGIIAVLGLIGSAQPVWNKILGLDSHIEAPKANIEFIKVSTIQDLQYQLDQAKLAGKPVMLDFYADWCVACKEFEKYTFHEANVEQKLQQFVLLQADVTKNQAQDIQLLEHLQVLGLPTIDFWDANGQRLSSSRLTGFVKAEPFLNHLQRVNP